MNKTLSDDQKSLIRKQGDDLIAAMHQVEEMNELAHALGVAEGYAKALADCGLLVDIGLNQFLERSRETHNAVAKKKGWFTRF
ncbi:hypothetical protein K5D34_04300 [Pseudomonas cichorii]|nr:hypothetical protein [Pseudomonas cichorii]MBX8508914.1 hypothetical protein [Pseudomonas cichorii]MBX8524477.1 hypothetical protein [Pseudomonas cichorii]